MVDNKLKYHNHPDQDVSMLVQNTQEFGALVKAQRKKLNLTQTDLAAASGVGERFIRELEHGKPSCQLDKALLVALMLGIRFEATV